MLTSWHKYPVCSFVPPHYLQCICCVTGSIYLQCIWCVIEGISTFLSFKKHCYCWCLNFNMWVCNFGMYLWDSSPAGRLERARPSELLIATLLGSLRLLCQGFICTALWLRTQSGLWKYLVKLWYIFCNLWRYAFPDCKKIGSHLPFSVCIFLCFLTAFKSIYVFFED